jgi:hypothetical protein
MLSGIFITYVAELSYKHIQLQICLKAPVLK